MGLPWFRLYHEWDSDPKVQIMPEVMQRRLVMLFCSRCRCDAPVKFHETETAFHWRISIEELAETKALFMQQGFIDEGWNLINWDNRQFLSDSSAERVRRYRERLATSQKRNRNVTKHHSDGDVTGQDTDSDTDKTKKKTKTPAKAKPSPDHRAGEFRLAFQDGFKVANGVPAPWDGKEASNLSRFLKANPAITLEQWRHILFNRTLSPVNQKASLSTWVARALAWLDEPADEWGKAINGRSGGSFGNRGQARTNGNLEALRRAVEQCPQADVNGAGRGEAGGREHGDLEPVLTGVM